MALFATNDGTGFRMNYDAFPGLVPENTLFIHGNLASGRWFLPAQEVLEKNAKGQAWAGTLVTADFRGCGKSSAPNSPEEVDMFRFAADYIALVKELKLAPVNLIGHSTGGLIAAVMMSLEPNLFKKAVLLDPVGATGVTFNDAMIGAFEAMKTDKDLVATVMNTTIHGNDAGSDFFRQVVVEDAFAAVKVVGHLVLKALDGLDIRSNVAKIPHPVLVMHGDQDVILPISEAENLAKLLPHGRFETLKGHGHSALVEDPKMFVEKVRGFLF